MNSVYTHKFATQSIKLNSSCTIRYKPAIILEMISYQYLICSAITLVLLQSYLQYDAKFRTLSATNPQLHLDQQHPDLWLEWLALRKYCPCSPFRDSKSNFAPSEYRKSLQPICGELNQGCCTSVTYKYCHICLSY